MSYVDTNSLDGFEVHADGTQVEVVCPRCRDTVRQETSPTGLRELIHESVDHTCEPRMERD